MNKIRIINKILKMIISISILLLIIGLSFAFFTANISGSESTTTLSASGGTLAINMDGGSAITVNSMKPESNAFASKTITIIGTNTTDLPMPYTLNLVIDSNSFASDSITYTLTSTNTGQNGVIIPSLSTPKNIPTSSSNITLGIGYFINAINKVHTYVLNMYFLDSGANQNSEKGKTIEAHVEVSAGIAGEPTGWSDAGEGTLLKAIKDTNILSKPQTIPGQQINDASEAVMASTVDDYGTTYYFRGTVENNYVVFANMCWRIVRVTGNGAIKLTLYNYNPNLVANPCDTSQNGDTYAFARYNGETYTTVFNANYSYNAYIGFMYGMPNSVSYSLEHANINKSAILINLETWYTSKLASYSSYLADTIWCNDKSTTSGTGYGNTNSEYGAYNRIFSSYSPSLICPNDANGGKISKFTADDTYGNNELDYKIGLLTADEVSYAGGAGFLTYNSTFYLYRNASGDNWWLLSPGMLSSGETDEFNVWDKGSMFFNRVSYSRGLRPTISLLPLNTISGGLGTASSPFIVS